MCARVRRERARRRGGAVAASGGRAAADRGQGERAPAAPGLLPGLRGSHDGRAAGRVAVGVRAAGCRPRSSRWRCATASRAAPPPSSPASCSGSSSRPGRSTRSSSAPATRSPRRTPGWSRRSSTRAVVNIDETGWKTGASAARSGARSPATTALFRIAAGRHAVRGADSCSANATTGSSAPTATRGYDYLDPTRRQLCWAHLLRDFTAHSEGMGEQAQFGAAGLVVANDLFKAWQQFQHDGDRAKLRRRITPLQAKLRAELEHAARKSTTHQVPPPVRPQPPQTLARPLDLQPHRRRRADQQPRRTRPPRRRHPPQALARHPIRTRRTQPRTAPLRLDHLPTPQAIALRLPHRSHHRPRPRRPHPRPQLTAPTG